MSLLLQLSDLHFGTERASVVEALAVLAHEQRPDVLVLCGDLTQRARPGQFRAVRAFVHGLGVPMLAVPGNHDLPLFDLWTRLCRPYARYRAAFGADLEPVYRSPALMVVGVNTTRAWRHQAGEISACQVDRVAAWLQGAGAAQLRIVVTHQPVAVTRADEHPALLRGHALALQCWAGAGADLVLSGHLHQPGVVALPGLVRPMWTVQAGTAVSSRVRAGQPNSVNLLRWGGGSAPGVCQIEQWDFSAECRAFVRVQVTTVRPDRAGPRASPPGW